MPKIPTPSQCKKACSVHEPCIAYIFVADVSGENGCELCVTETRGTDVMNFAHAHEGIMIGKQALEQFLLGKVSFYIISLLL